MTREKLVDLYSAFFKAEGIKYNFDIEILIQPLYGFVWYDGLVYIITVDPRFFFNGMFFEMYTEGPDFEICERTEYWEGDPELQGKIESIANKVNEKYKIGKVIPETAIKYMVKIELQSPEQLKDFFYEAVHELKAIESDFLDELKKIGVNFQQPNAD